MAKTIDILSGTTFTPTGDQIGALAQIIVWGAGASGGGSLGCCVGGTGGTSGCVASISNFLLTGATLNIQIPAANSASQCWFNSSATVSANSQSTSTAGMVGTTKAAGAAGGAPSLAGGGGAGAAGLSGGAGGGGNAVGTSGGAGGVAGTPSYTLTAGGTVGPATGGAGGGAAQSGHNAGAGFGGGGGGIGFGGASVGAGAQGGIVIIYTPASDAGTFQDYSADELIAQMNKPQALAYH